MAAERRTMFECGECKRYFFSMEVFVRHICCRSRDGDGDNAAASGTQVATEFDGAGVVLNDDTTEEEVSSQINVQNEEERSLSWVKAATLMLISEYKKRQDKIESGRMRKNKAFGEIAEVMKKSGYKFTGEQCATRFKTISRAYKQIKDHNARSGNGKKSYEYEKELDQLFGKRPNIQPEFVLGSASDVSEKDSPQRSEKNAAPKASKRPGTESENEEGNKVSAPKCRKTQVSEVITYLETYTKNKEKQHEIEQKKRDERHKEKMSIFQEMVGVLKTKQ